MGLEALNLFDSKSEIVALFLPGLLGRVPPVFLQGAQAQPFGQFPEASYMRRDFRVQRVLGRGQQESAVTARQDARPGHCAYAFFADSAYLPAAPVVDPPDAGGDAACVVLLRYQQLRHGTGCRKVRWIGDVLAVLGGHGGAGPLGGPAGLVQQEQPGVLDMRVMRVECGRHLAEQRQHRVDGGRGWQRKPHGRHRAEWCIRHIGHQDQFTGGEQTRFSLAPKPGRIDATEIPGERRR